MPNSKNTTFWQRLGQRFRSTTPDAASPSAVAIQPLVYAIGDIHGRLDLLLPLLDAIRKDREANAAADAIMVFLGDYIDRGPASRDVISLLIEISRTDSGAIFLRGNHEQVLLDFLSNSSIFEDWSRFGGLETLASYGLRPRLNASSDEADSLRQALAAALPAEHLAFLRATRPSFETTSHYFAHAGVNPQVALNLQRPQDLMWIREPFLNSTRSFGKVVVHGHTPVAVPEILPNRINVDTGAYLTGRLSCAAIKGKSVRILSGAG